MSWLPSVPGAPTLSLPELVWLLGALAGCLLAARAYHLAGQSRVRLKNAIRLTSSAACLMTGVLSALTPPPVSPTMLSVLVPITIAFACLGMALVSVIDVQAEDEGRPLTIVDIEHLRRAAGQ